MISTSHTLSKFNIQPIILQADSIDILSNLVMYLISVIRVEFNLILIKNIDATTDCS